jgi:hypothetical protein
VLVPALVSVRQQCLSPPRSPCWALPFSAEWALWDVSVNYNKMRERQEFSCLPFLLWIQRSGPVLQEQIANAGMSS